jgi:D-arginine dehydrogenase
MSNRCDVLVIGAGIAGASVAAELSRAARVVLLEMEAHPGYHTTGRSAAVFAPTYGPPPIRALTRASEPFFLNPPEGFAGAPLIRPRGVLFVARADQLDALAAEHAVLSREGRVDMLDAAQTQAAMPLLRAGYAAAGMLDHTTADIDVAALHQGYLRNLQANGGALVTRAEVTSLSRDAGLWRARTAAGQYAAPLVVNAAGAWAELVGRLAGAEAISLVPKRRTALLLAAPAGLDISEWPLVVDADESFYLKPDAGRFLISPANEDPEPPCDVQPDEMDIAHCIDRIESAFDLTVRRIEHRWEGLRSFVTDKAPVAGFSELAEGFYWLAGQGGYGIQSAPALARFAAAQVQGGPVPGDILGQGLDPASVAPGRLGRATPAWMPA